MLLMFHFLGAVSRCCHLYSGRVVSDSRFDYRETVEVARDARRVRCVEKLAFMRYIF